jgi:hypothetical protein
MHAADAADIPRSTTLLQAEGYFLEGTSVYVSIYLP